MLLQIPSFAHITKRQLFCLSTLNGRQLRCELVLTGILTAGMAAIITLRMCPCRRDVYEADSLLRHDVCFNDNNRKLNLPSAFDRRRNELVG
ncbi:hypothetical protein RRG08_044611 [Elysia crispata]|uniref:Uncharacterized protein n=1 Tax=Elysia crispata TaxID=231223 RepID=A0AAE0YM81_9GAST|nr:hypothetical protein RRG08_044611 [Elysia crispata]